MNQQPMHLYGETATEQPNLWSNIDQLDHDGSVPVATAPALPRVRADALGRALGAVDVDTLRGHHLALAMAVIELAADAGAPLPWGHDDPTVALLRAAAKLSLTVPGATSSAAADLVQQLEVRASDDTATTSKRS